LAFSFRGRWRRIFAVVYDSDEMLDGFFVLALQDLRPFQEAALGELGVDVPLQDGRGLGFLHALSRKLDLGEKLVDLDLLGLGPHGQLALALLAPGVQQCHVVGGRVLNGPANQNAQRARRPRPRRLIGGATSLSGGLDFGQVNKANVFGLAVLPTHRHLLEGGLVGLGGQRLLGTLGLFRSFGLLFLLGTCLLLARTLVLFGAFAFLFTTFFLLGTFVSYRTIVPSGTFVPFWTLLPFRTFVLSGTLVSFWTLLPSRTFVP